MITNWLSHWKDAITSKDQRSWWDLRCFVRKVHSGNQSEAEFEWSKLGQVMVKWQNSKPPTSPLFSQYVKSSICFRTLLNRQRWWHRYFSEDFSNYLMKGTVHIFLFNTQSWYHGLSSQSMEVFRVNITHAISFSIFQISTWWFILVIPIILCFAIF